MIRKTLKAAYPGVTFRVRSDGFSGGDSVDVEWRDGPTSDAVEQLVSQHEKGHVDGMEDLYHYSNSRDDIPQTTYLHCDRHMSHDAHRAMVAHLNQRFGWELRLIERTSPAWRKEPAHTWFEIDHASDQHTGNGWQSHEIYRHFVTLSLLCGHCAAATLPGDTFCPACGLALTPRDHLAEQLADAAAEPAPAMVDHYAHGHPIEQEDDDPAPAAWDISPSMAAYDGGRYPIERSGIVRLI